MRPMMIIRARRSLVHCLVLSLLLCFSVRSVDPPPVRAQGIGVAEVIGIISIAVGVLATDRKSTRLNSSHIQKSRMPSSA